MGARRLRESEARLKLATEVAKLGIFVWHIDEDRASWENDRMYEIFGRKREDGPVNGTAFMDEVVHPEYREAFRQAMEATLQGGDRFRFEGKICLPDKTLRWIEINGQLQLQSDESSGQILGTIQDTTRVKESEQALQESSKRLGEFAAIVDSSDDVILSKDLNGIITSWNTAAARLFGYSAEEMIGSSILKIIPEHLHSDEKTILENIRAGPPRRALRDNTSHQKRPADRRLSHGISGERQTWTGDWGIQDSSRYFRAKAAGKILVASRKDCGDGPHGSDDRA